MLWAELFVSGVLLGGIYALAAMGFSLIWGTLNVLNLSQAGFLVIGAYIAWLFSTLGIDPIIGATTAIAVGACGGYVVQRIIVDRTIRYGIFMTLIATFGVNLVLENTVTVLFASDLRSVTLPSAADAIELGGVRINVARLQVFSIALMAVAALQLFMTRTRLGHMIQATALDRTGAEITGIDVGFIYRLTAVIAGASAGLAGALMAFVLVITPHLGTDFLGPMFAVACLGGLGVIWSVLLAGVAVGVAETFATALIAPQAQAVISAAVVLGVLLVRPRGIAGRRFFAEI